MKKHDHQEHKSLKTVYIYLFLVFLVICVALAIKVFYTYQQSKYDPSHEFILAITQQGSVKEIIAFHPETQAISLLEIQDQHVPYPKLAKDYGIATDGYITTQQEENNTDITAFLWGAIVHTGTWQSNLTILDKFRLLLFTKNVSINNKNIEQVSLAGQSPDLNTIIATALTDQDISSENVTIQIINATSISGLGQRLGKILTNLGANVVDVSSSEKIQKNSTLVYYGDTTYTADRIDKFLNIPTGKLTKQTIADIVITIGTDKKNTDQF